MLNPGNVVAIEGITGIGKSHLGQQLALALTDSGVNARWYFELEQANPLIPKFHDHRIIESAVDSWKEFLESNDYAEQVSVVDGRLFLINIVWSLQHGIPSSEIESRLVPLLGLVEKHGVVVIYMRTNNLQQIFQNTLQKRKCEDWYIENCESSEYCKSNGFRGRASVLEFYSEVDRIMAKVLGNISANSQVVDVDGGDWVSAYRRIFSTFGLIEPAQVRSTSPEAERLVGIYVGVFNGSTARFVVDYLDGELVLTEHPFTVFKPVEQIWHLVKVDQSTYLGKGQPVKLKFVVSDSGNAAGLYHIGMYDHVPSKLSDLNRGGIFEKCES